MSKVKVPIPEITLPDHRVDIYVNDDGLFVLEVDKTYAGTFDTMEHVREHVRTLCSSGTVTGVLVVEHFVPPPSQPYNFADIVLTRDGNHWRDNVNNRRVYGNVLQKPPKEVYDQLAALRDAYVSHIIEADNLVSEMRSIISGLPELVSYANYTE